MKKRMINWKRWIAAALCMSVLCLAACAGSRDVAVCIDAGGGQSTSGGQSTFGGKSSADGQSSFDGKSAKARELSKGITANPVSADEKDISATVAATDFGLRMFREELKEGENILISPASVLFALGMTANGAKGDTLAQFEEVFRIPMDELNTYLYAYRNSLPNEKNCKVKVANSIWFKEDPGIKVSQDFLQKNADYYAADIYAAPFNDSTKDSINKWVDQNTDGMIKQILDSIPDNTLMYLINAMAFDAKWMEPYKESQVREGTFTGINGTEQRVDFMYSEESKYLEDENAAGFLKYYEGGKYAFAALLPDEGVSLENYAASLTGEKLNRLVQNPESITVYASIPKFEDEYSTELRPILSAMGITDAFDEAAADFSDLAVSENGNIYINKVLHKTYICVDEKGTKAAAVTVVDAQEECMAMEEPEYRVVYLDRPFLYCLIDCEEGLPIFVGAVYTVQ